MLVDGADARRVSNGRGHMSYPTVVELRGRQWVLPEVARWSSPTLFALEGSSLREAQPLRVEGDPRLLDPTLVEENGRLYLFANDRAVGSNVLHLWVAEGLEETFHRHPASPIRISPDGGRIG